MDLVINKYEALIRGCLAGQCSAEETLELLSWVAESEENRHYFNSLKDEYDVWRLTDFAMPEDIDVDAALDVVNKRIDAIEETETKVVQMPWLRRNYKWVSSVAAAVVVVLFLGFFFTKPINNTVMVAYNEAQPEMVYQLPDGSSFTFEGNGTLGYPKQFATDGRSVKFEGKARFDIVKDASRPFVIHCEGLDVEVLGTSFMLEANKEKHVVDLYSGQVRMTTLDKQGRKIAHLDIQPNERGIWIAESGELKVMSYPEVKEEELRNDRVIDFNNVSLSTIVETLEYVYQVEIDLDEAYAAKKLTARFTDQETVEEVLETIAAVFDLTVAKTDNGYTIR